MKKLPKRYRDSIAEINAMLEVINEQGLMAFSYMGSTHEFYMELSKPIEVNGLEVTICGGTGNYQAIDPVEFFDLDPDQEYWIFEDQKQGLSYTLRHIKSAFKRAIKNG
jgi:hypothetical protein